MRFAGSAVEDYLGGGPDMGALTQNAAKRDAEKVIQDFKSVSQIGGSGAQQLGSTLGQEAVSSAQTNLAGAQAQAQMMGTIGKLGGQFLGGLDLGGGGGMGGSFTGDYSMPSGINWGSLWGK